MPGVRDRILKRVPGGAQASAQSVDGFSLLRRVFLAALIFLISDVLLEIVYGYRRYFPADFKVDPATNFLMGREAMFVGSYKVAFYIHIIASPCAILIGCLLTFGRKLRRLRRLHRVLGRVQIMLVLLFVVPSGLVMSTEALTGAIAGWGFATQALLTGASAVATVLYAIRGSYAKHQRWATRCFVLLCAPLLLRLVGGATAVMQIDTDQLYQVTAWAGWIVPLAICEIYFLKIHGQSLKDHSRKKDSPMQTNLRFERRNHVSAFTLVELLVVLAIIGILVGVLLPVQRGAREAARRMSCSNNFKQIGLGLHNYHSVYKQLPSAMMGTSGPSPLAGNQQRLSGLVSLLPFIEHQDLWEQVSNSSSHDMAYPAMGPAPWVSNYEPWRTEISTLRCPSDPGADREFGMTNYVFSIGDVGRDIHQPTQTRGMFAVGRSIRFREVLDGLSNTVMMGETSTYLDDFGIGGGVAMNQSVTLLDSPALCTELLDPERPNFYLSGTSVDLLGRGGCWADGAAGYGLTNLILPPNSASFAVGPDQPVDGVYSVSSRHQGGTHMLMGDGAVIFITDSIEAGDATLPVPASDEAAVSRYGLWGALGTIAAKEEIEERLNN